MIFVGIDWAEEHHDALIENEAGATLARERVAEGLAGVGKLHARIANYAEDPGEVAIGIELDRGLLVGSLVAAGYQVYAVNPKAVDRYRDRHAVSGAKSDPGDAKVLADLVRTDRHNHRQVAGDSDLADAIKVTARAHQSLIWTRQRQINQLRSALAAHPRFHMHYTPTYSSWINQVERWFGYLTDQLIRRGDHRSVQALEADIRAWINDWNEHPKPFIWTKTAEQILASLGRLLKRTNGAGHSVYASPRHRSQ